MKPTCSKRLEKVRTLGLASLLAVMLMIVALAAGCGSTQSESASSSSESENSAYEAPEEDAAQDDSGSSTAVESVREIVDDYTWDELSQISSEIGAAADESSAIEVAKKYNLCTPEGKLDGTQSKSVTLTDGTQTSVQIIGFAHDDKTEGSKAGITFLFGECISEEPMNSTSTNVGGWEDSQMRANLNSEGLNLLPEDLASKIVAVDKLTNNVGETESVSSVTATSDKLWLPSSTELYGKIDWNFNQSYDGVQNAEGSEYKLYRDTNVDPYDDNDILMKTYLGNACSWWERMPGPGTSDYFGYVASDGEPGGEKASLSEGVVPGFCI